MRVCGFTAVPARNFISSDEATLRAGAFECCCGRDFTRREFELNELIYTPHFFVLIVGLYPGDLTMFFLLSSRIFKYLNIYRKLIAPFVSLTDISFLSIDSLFFENKKTVP
jgi:hypothetical protein